jgi:glycogen debranching enzyme
MTAGTTPTSTRRKAADRRWKATPSSGDGVAVDPFTPSRRLLHADYTVLCSGPDGAISADPEGLYDHDTRVLSHRRLTIDGRDLTFVSSAELAADHRLITLLAPQPGGEADGPRLPQDAIEVRIESRVGPALHEQITLRNRSMVAVSPELRLDVDADFADVMEVGRPRRQTGETTRRQGKGGGLELTYSAVRGKCHVERGIRVLASEAARVQTGDSPALSWRPELGPRASWVVELRFESLVDGQWRSPDIRVATGDSSNRREVELHAWRTTRPTVESEPPLLGRIADRAMEDLFALRNRELDGDEGGAWVPNAGVPTYTGVFGRDALTAGWQSSLLGPEISRGALRLLAAHQAVEDEEFRDAEPGKLLHEMRRGPLSELDVIPQRAYYGTQTTPALFVLALSELWHWTGDTEALRRYRAPAMRAVAWAAKRGDLDGDGFVESQTRSPVGLQNQGWKDSNEAIRYPDGRNVGPPLATVEEQAFHILAIERMAEILVALEDDDEANVLLARARALRDQWHAAFWLPAADYYAMALDSGKRAVESIGSNAGHALGAGLIPREHAARVADRLLAPDLFSGWGVRTLSSEHPSYNPFAYHLGTVWPVEQATFALGFKRYGLDDHADRLILGLIDAAAAFRNLRLPEALSGLSRDDSPVPVPYPNSNSPQAWTASATIQLIQVLLGLYPFAPLAILALVRPRLPREVRTLTVRRLRIGDATVSLRFQRRDDGSATHEVIEQDGRLLVIEAPPPQDVTGGTMVEAVKAWAIEHAPGRQARALRIALGLEGKE